MLITIKRLCFCFLTLMTLCQGNVIPFYGNMTFLYPGNSFCIYYNETDSNISATVQYELSATIFNITICKGV